MCFASAHPLFSVHESLQPHGTFRTNRAQPYTLQPPLHSPIGNCQILGYIKKGDGFGSPGKYI